VALLCVHYGDVTAAEEQVEKQNYIYWELSAGDAFVWSNVYYCFHCDKCCVTGDLYSGIDKDYSLLGYNAMFIDSLLPTSSTTMKMEAASCS
jgi:hypothetical protein